MCGILGAASSEHLVRVSEDAFSSIDHRGPDGGGIEQETREGWSWALAHKRLSIIDLSERGNQPMSTEDGNLIAIFGGEIYNQESLRRVCEERGHHFRSDMDGEVILHLWEDEGPSCLSRLNGIYSIALIDRRNEQLFLARDPLGVKPLFFSSGPGTIQFASELAALAKLAPPTGSPDLTALAQFLTFLWIPAPRTPMESIKALRPGFLLSWRKGRQSEARFAPQLTPRDSDDNRSLEVLTSELRDRMQDACSRQLMSDVPVGLMASGGIDSSLIWRGTSHGLNRVFTIAWHGSDGEGLNEDFQAVSSLQERFGTAMTVIDGSEVDHEQGQPRSADLFADPAFQLTRAIAKAARQEKVKVLFSGQGGDELFGGYRRHLFAAQVSRFGKSPKAMQAVGRALLRTLPLSGLKKEFAERTVRALERGTEFDAYMQLCSYSTARERARVLGCFEHEVTDEIVWSDHRGVYDELSGSTSSFLKRAMALDLNVYLPGLGLAYVDRAGMEHGIEIRVPWLDLELVHWALGLPDRALVSRFSGKVLPKRLASDDLAKNVATRAKRGFAVPWRRLTPAGEKGEYGHRQGVYFARAVETLGSYHGLGGEILEELG